MGSAGITMVVFTRPDLPEIMTTLAIKKFARSQELLWKDVDSTNERPSLSLTSNFTQRLLGVFI